jgi:hypothetical protein
MSKLIVTIIDALRARPRLLKGIFLFILGFALFFDFYAERHGEHFVGDRIRMFWAFFGLVGAIGMTKFMKWIGYGFLMQPLDFYSRHDGGEDK